MQLFYNNDLKPTDTQFTFDKIESRHIVRVLRKKEGDKLTITNGKGHLFNAEISIANDKKCLVTILSATAEAKPWNYYLHIAIAPTKNNDRFEWFLEKATEIGIDEITPIICDHSERKVYKTERGQKIIESAAKQSLKYHFPKLNEPVKFSELINSDIIGSKFIAHCEDDTTKIALKNSLTEEKNITILIGPEGDFSTQEIEKAIQTSFKAISLGKSRLRTETAGIAAVHTISLLN